MGGGEEEVLNLILGTTLGTQRWTIYFGGTFGGWKKSTEMLACFLTGSFKFVGDNTTNEMRFGAHQSTHQIVELFLGIQD